ncbi:tripartite tricarboxylate transporter TctB family protein [Uliginosibacterium sp. 31-16]|uniref:tripartite tricarboxylate transporter TctB family protein n=1 Tax=Uliginosibacterium sp. 31-16 TaxID=3068315 RepID=UPI00274000DA|nr:tripartite tricarboxylate transporter TctB family protein [Uliginosibacterium sp. 31-16]MDP5239075.1 tripartite tricarboxylate transporter TctB family protein [Uliginosibacterium sp. 31-16]
MARISSDRFAGLLFILFGGGFVFGAGAYDMGTAAQMGPGYFPRLLGGLLVLLGIAIFASVKTSAGRPSAGSLPWRAILAVLCGVAAFGLLLKPLGLFLAALLLVGLSSLAQQRPRWGEVLLSALVLAGAASVVFVWGLKLPLPLWPAFG